MPRHSRGADSVLGEACKIRKRGCSSSSSSSSVLQSYRVRRLILVGKRGGSSTPVPTWKMNARSPSSTVGISGSSDHQPSHIGGYAMQAPVSARKLANALWELNNIPRPQMIQDQRGRRSRKETRAIDRMARSIQPDSLPRHLSDPSHSPDSETMNRSRISSHRRKMRLVPQKLQSNGHDHRFSDFISNGSLMEIETCSQGPTSMGSIIGNNSCLKDLSNGLVTSKELLKLLNRIWGVKEKHSSSIPLVSALHVELDQACLQVGQLIQEQMSGRNEINYLKKRFMEEKSAWKSKEQERFRAAARSIMEELESEKKLRRRAERLNQKLGLELAKMKTSLVKAVKELESERRAREIIEQVCNELVKGLGEDKAEVEELKRESAKAREELEEEREMLQLADEWREERLQMKLSEAKFQFEEKNAAVDQLRNELEAFLTTKRAKEPRSGNINPEGKSEVEDQSLLVHPSKSGRDDDLNVDEREEAGEVEDGEDDEDGVDSVDSDLHSIELNMDNQNKSYSWSYDAATAKDDAKLALFEGKKEGRITNCNQVSGSCFSLDRGIISKSFQCLGDGSDQQRLSKTSNLLEKKAHNLDQERYKSVMELRDRMLAASMSTLPRGLASPTRQWSRPQALQDTGDHEGSKITVIMKAARESGSKARLVISNRKSALPQLQIDPIQ